MQWIGVFYFLFILW